MFLFVVDIVLRGSCERWHLSARTVILKNTLTLNTLRLDSHDSLVRGLSREVWVATKPEREDEQQFVLFLRYNPPFPISSSSRYTVDVPRNSNSIRSSWKEPRRVHHWPKRNVNTLPTEFSTNCRSVLSYQSTIERSRDINASENWIQTKGWSERNIITPWKRRHCRETWRREVHLGRKNNILRKLTGSNSF